MKASTRDTTKPKKRPPEAGVPVMVRLQPDLLDWLDAERSKYDDQPSRPEMVRRVLEEKQHGS